MVLYPFNTTRAPYYRSPRKGRELHGAVSVVRLKCGWICVTPPLRQNPFQDTGLLFPFEPFETHLSYPYPMSGSIFAHILCIPARPSIPTNNYACSTHLGRWNASLFTGCDLRYHDAGQCSIKLSLSLYATISIKLVLYLILTLHSK
jgi:hypothetical protein